MCRLLGVSFGPNPEAIDTTEIAARLFPALVRQGPHAYGWMHYDGEGVGYEKYEGRCDTKLAEANIRAEVPADVRWLVGHTRWATHGSPKDMRNNHPLPHGNILGVHNGVLRNHGEILSKTGREIEGTEVDSEAIFASVNRWGPSPGLRRIEGDMVTIYTDRRRPHVLHLARTAGRQITLGWTEKGNLFFASDKIALFRLEPEVKFVKFSTVSENRLLIIRNGKIIQRYRFRPIPKRPTISGLNRQWVPTRTSDDDAIDRLIERAQSHLDQARAERRGEMLFPKKPERNPLPEKETPKPTSRKAKRKARAQSRNIERRKSRRMVYFGGELMTEAEFDRLSAEADLHNPESF